MNAVADSPAKRAARPWSFLLKGIGVVLFLWILSRIDPAQVATALSQAWFPGIVTALALFPVIHLLKALRWHVLIRGAGVHQPFGVSFRTYIASLFLGTMTPGNVGESMKIAYLRRAGVPVKTGALLTVLDRLYDVLWIGLFALPSVFFLLQDRFSLLLCVVAGMGMGMVLLGLFLRRKISNGGALLRSSALSWKPHAITIVNWSVYYLQLSVLAAAFHLQVPILPFLGIMTMAGIINLLAIAPAGLGTREATLLYFFATYSVPPALTVAFSFTMFLLSITSSCLGAYFWFRDPVVSR